LVFSAVTAALYAPFIWEHWVAWACPGFPDLDRQTRLCIRQAGERRRPWRLLALVHGLESL